MGIKIGRIEFEEKQQVMIYRCVKTILLWSAITVDERETT